MIRLLPPDLKEERYGLRYRFVTEEDSEFIVKMRTDPKLGKYIHITENSIEKQIQYIREYKKREDAGLDYYFMFELNDGTRLGTSRIYDITESSFVTGSWLFIAEAPYGASFIGDIVSHEIAYELFPNSKHLFDIKKENHNVLKYAKLFNPQVIRETEDTYYFQNTKDNFEAGKKKLLRSILPILRKELSKLYQQ